ncbi:hypothetical protein DH2020_026622 [Rehmannia glutinosa]|uniref:Uncharacterized protein n=1 Tax=Rehmannia glutinosa TaxID=99300 RepID=A0ABR0VYV3_REHGL
MEPDRDSQSPPFWFQPSTNLHHRRRRPQPSPLLNPVALILAIPILTILILFFLVPPFLSHTNQILRPNSVRKSWDSLNIVLVVFAILCGVFARRNDGSPPSDDADNQNLTSVSSVSSLVNRPRQSVSTWLDFPDRKEYNSVGDVSSASGSRLRRSSSSYPDLRQESLWESGGGNRNRFFDDFEVMNYYRSPPPESFDRLPRRSHEAEREEVETVVREIPVDRFEVSAAPPPPTPPESAVPPPTPMAPPSTANLKRRRSLHSVPRREKVERQRDKGEIISENQRPVSPPAPPPPPPPPPAAVPEFQFPVEISEMTHRKKSGATKEIATAIVSMYKGQRKRKKRVKSRNIYETAPQNSSQPSVIEPQSAPPPPPPRRRLLLPAI